MMVLIFVLSQCFIVKLLAKPILLQLISVTFLSITLKLFHKRNLAEIFNVYIHLIQDHTNVTQSKM